MNGVNQSKRTWQMEPADTRPEMSAKMPDTFVAGAGDVKKT
jgi:hypothetical protein